MKITNEVYEDIAFTFFKPGHRYSNKLKEGLIEEAYEVSSAVEHSNREEILDELSDVLWYITVMAKQQGSGLSDLMRTNIIKLEDRILNGKKSKIK